MFYVIFFVEGLTLKNHVFFLLCWGFKNYMIVDCAMFSIFINPLLLCFQFSYWFGTLVDDLSA